MKITQVSIHNFRSFVDQTFKLSDYSLFAGPNNAGKSTVVNALLGFYGKIKITESDTHCSRGGEIWIECTYELNSDDLNEYGNDDRVKDEKITIRRIFNSSKKDKSEPLGKLIYIPSSSVAEEHLKISGPSEFRDLLMELISPLAKMPEYEEVNDALEAFGHSAAKSGAALNRIVAPMNDALKHWRVTVAMNLRPITCEEICKLLLQFSFFDESVKSEVALSKFGSGLQRMVIYEMVRLIATIEDEMEKIESGFTFIAFEEPENFLHPHQQEILSYSLKQLAGKSSQQVLITTHSPIFLGRAADDLKTISRVTKKDATSSIFQISNLDYDNLLASGFGFGEKLREFANDQSIPENRRARATRMVNHLPTDEVKLQDEEFQYQLALNAERCSMFFAQHVIIVEGETEKTLFEILLREAWTDIQNKRLYILNAMGKFNVHRFMALFKKLGLSHSVLIDDDGGRDLQGAINDFVVEQKNEFTFGEIVLLPGNIEEFLGLPQVPRDAGLSKPLEMLKAYKRSAIDPLRLQGLRALFEERLIPRD